MGIGFILFSNEEVIMEGQRCCARTQSPLPAEAESLSWALKEVSDRGFHRVRFESDSQQLVTIIQKDDKWSSLAQELEEIKATGGGRSGALSFANVNLMVQQGLAHGAGLNEPV
ncbi:hypothetical protein Bca4012_018512 [Brassica carinata]|uniref:RNase H type-1 domain-containing protein n=1 Tax=Brassica carinata TaxID=52824 RepID=A0A8X7WM16_BRACI|nr:hypothetical protein Bca52824_003087 [Brassica carinata]